MPQDIAGMIGLPYIGNIYYVDPTNGADTHGGTDESDAFKTFTAAYAALTDNNHDVIVIVPGGTGSGTGTVETAAIVWSKNLCHLVGNVAGTPMSSRARITTATTALSPFITISGSGNSFHNVQFQSNAAANYILERVSGNRNYFENVHFANINATALSNSGACALELYGAQENYFVNCTIGDDTTTMSSTSANLRLTLGTQTTARNVFDGCIFPMFTSASTNYFIKQPDTSGIDRFNLFRDCQFINAISSTSTTITDAIAMAASPGGMLVLHNCLGVGMTGWADNLTNIRILGFSTNATILTDYCKGVNPTA